MVTSPKLATRFKRNSLHTYCTPPMGPIMVISIFFKQAIYGIYGLMSVTYLSLGKTFGCTSTFCFCQFEISTLRSSTCSFCLFLSLVILLHVRKYLYVPNSLIIYPRTFQKKSPKNTCLSIDLSITIRVFWSRQLAGPPGRFAVCPWRNGIPQVYRLV